MHWPGWKCVFLPWRPPVCLTQFLQKPSGTWFSTLQAIVHALQSMHFDASITMAYFGGLLFFIR